MEKAVLPSLSHTVLSDWDYVYEPSDDTFLLCDALLAEKEYFLDLGVRVVVEIGSGSGCVISYMALLLKDLFPVVKFVAVDVNSYAVDLTKRTALANKVRVETYNQDFLHYLSNCTELIDILIFNPPYVPTPDEEIPMISNESTTSELITASWAGGYRGRRIIDTFIPLISKSLSEKGRCYLVLVAENCPREISSILLSFGLKSRIIVSRKARNEELIVLVCWKI